MSGSSTIVNIGIPLTIQLALTTDSNREPVLRILRKHRPKTEKQNEASRNLLLKSRHVPDVQSVHEGFCSYFFTLLIKVFEMTHGRPNDVQRMKTDKVFVAVVALI